MHAACFYRFATYRLSFLWDEKDEQGKYTNAQKVRGKVSIETETGERMCHEISQLLFRATHVQQRFQQILPY
jgi:hypothetical protein